MPKVDVNKKREYLADIPVKGLWRKFETGEIEKNLQIPLGQNKNNQDHTLNLGDCSHLIVAGETLSGVGMFRRVALATLLKFNEPEDLKFILIDTLNISFFDFKNIDKHLLFPIIKEAKEAKKSLEWARKESEKRLLNLYKPNEVRNFRNFGDYNENNPDNKIPAILIIITELADIINFDKNIDSQITSISMMAKATGIYFMLMTQRPTTVTVPGLIKANIYGRIAFKLPDKKMSKVILDEYGAEKLLGQGDMLFNSGFLRKSKRLQGYSLDETEIAKMVF